VPENPLPVNSPARPATDSGLAIEWTAGPRTHPNLNVVVVAATT
jgi:hypothetical protein